MPGSAAVGGAISGVGGPPGMPLGAPPGISPGAGGWFAASGAAGAIGACAVLRCQARTARTTATITIANDTSRRRMGPTFLHGTAGARGARIRGAALGLRTLTPALIQDRAVKSKRWRD